MKLDAWFKKRGAEFIIERGKKLSERYGVSPKKAILRIQHCLDELKSYGCKPTFFVPAQVVRRNLPFILSLQEWGCEIGVHGYNHVDLKTYPPEDANQQLLRAVDVFRETGLEVHGFRCPYLSSSDSLIRTLSPGIFRYSSNKAVEWPYRNLSEENKFLLFSTIQQFYLPSSADTTPCMPYEDAGLVEIPVCVPDDLQLHDGLGYEFEHIVDAWSDMLYQTHERGELLNLMFHPELASFCEAPFVSILRMAQSLQPKVWVARLRDVSEWWHEKETFYVETRAENGGFSLHFHCTPRATLVYRGFEPPVQTTSWDANYQSLPVRQLRVEDTSLPFIGLRQDAPVWVEPALKRAGFILQTGDLACRCGLYLERERLAQFDNPVALIRYIDGLKSPLVRFWPWPDGAHSAMCITGDLDALSLLDYSNRLFAR